MEHTPPPQENGAPRRSVVGGAARDQRRGAGKVGLMFALPTIALLVFTVATSALAQQTRANTSTETYYPRRAHPNSAHASNHPVAHSRDVASPEQPKARRAVPQAQTQTQGQTQASGGASDDSTNLFFDVLSPDGAFRLVANLCPSSSSTLYWWPVDAGGTKTDGQWRRTVQASSSATSVQSLLCFQGFPASDATIRARVCIGFSASQELVVYSARLPTTFAQATVVPGKTNTLVLGPTSGLTSPFTKVYLTQVGRAVQDGDCASWSSQAVVEKGAYTVAARAVGMRWSSAGNPSIGSYALNTTLAQ